MPCTARGFRVRLNKILLTGAVKPKYEVQGCVAARRPNVSRSFALKRTKGLPLQWLGENKAGLLEFELDMVHSRSIKILLKLERRDGVRKRSMAQSFHLNVTKLQHVRKTPQGTEEFQLRSSTFKRGVTARLFFTSTVLAHVDHRFRIEIGQIVEHAQLPPELPHEDLPPSYAAVETGRYTESTHRLLNDNGEAEFLVRVIHCKLRCVSALQIISGNGVTARAHLIGREQLIEIRNQFPEQGEIGRFRVEEDAGERAMVIKGPTDHWMILKASYESSRDNKKSLCWQCYDFTGGAVKQMAPIVEDRCDIVDLGLASLYLQSGMIIISKDTAYVAEHLALCYGVAILFNLCVPERTFPNWALNEYAIFMAAGHGQELPSNSGLSAGQRQPDLLFLKDVRWEKDPQLPAYSTDLIPLSDALAARLMSQTSTSSDVASPDWEARAVFEDDAQSSDDCQVLDIDDEEEGDAGSDGAEMEARQEFQDEGESSDGEGALDFPPEEQDTDSDGQE